MSGHRVPISPTNHFYCATKYAVRAITEGHRQELRELKSNIRVAVLNKLCNSLSSNELFERTFIRQ